MQPKYVPMFIFGVALILWPFVPQEAPKDDSPVSSKEVAVQINATHEVTNNPDDPNDDVFLRLSITISPLLSGDEKRQVVIDVTPLTKGRVWLDGTHFVRTVTANSSDSLAFTLHIVPPTYALWELRPLLGLEAGEEPKDPDMIVDFSLKPKQDRTIDWPGKPRTWADVNSADYLSISWEKP